MNDTGRIIGGIILIIIVLFLIGYLFFGSNPRIALLRNQVVASPIYSGYYPSNYSSNGTTSSSYSTSANSYRIVPGASSTSSNGSYYPASNPSYSSTSYSTTTYPTYPVTYPNQNCYTSGPDMYGRVTTACQY